MATLMMACRYPGCGYAALPGKKTCAKHEGELRYADHSKRYRPDQVQSGRWKKLRATVLGREPYCRRCGARAVVVDHIRPRRSGGTDDLDNLQPLCRACDNRKRAEENRDFPKT